MSRFYASIQGNRGEATRQGTTSSGITGHIRGWNDGAEVRCFANNKDHDVIHVSATGGSNDYRSNLIFAIVNGAVINYQAEALISAIEQLLLCAELNQDSLEADTQVTIHNVTKIVQKIKQDNQEHKRND